MESYWYSRFMVLVTPNSYMRPDFLTLLGANIFDIAFTK